MRGVLFSAGLISALTLLTNLLGFVRELLFARAFGATQEADSFVAAFSIVATCFLVLAGGPLQGAFMPRYQQAMVHEHHALAKGLWRATFAGVFIFAGAIGVAIYFGAERIVSWVVPGFDQESQVLTSQILRWLAPMVLLCSLGALFQSTLHAHRIFALPALIPVGNNLVLILVLVVLVPSYGLAGMSYGTVGGGALWLLLIPFVLQHLPRGAGCFDAGSLRDLMRALWPLIVLLGVDQVAGLVQKTLVSDLEAGSVAVLNYAARLEGLPVGIFAGALAAVIFPALVEVAARGDKQALEERFRFGVAAISFFLLPSAAFLIAESELIVKVLLERGAFTPEATLRTARALELYSAGLLSQGLIVYLNRVYFALGDTKTPMVVGVVTAVLHVFFCWLAVDSIGYLGIAIGTTFYAIAYFLMLIIWLRGKVNNPFHNFFISVWRPLIASSILMMAMCFFDLPSAMFGLLVGIVAFVVGYLLLLSFMRDPVLEDVKLRFFGVLRRVID